jgi:enterochelin esterase-like enzyme
MKKGAKEIIRMIIVFSGAILFMAGMPGCERAPDPVIKPEPLVRLLKNQTYKSSILKRDMYYAVLLPEGYDSIADPYPVVYLLHGFGDDETAWYEDGLIQYYSDKYAAENGPMIFVMPEAFNTYYVNKYNGNYPIMDVLVTELVPKIDSTLRTISDADHRAVMGYSMGGYGAVILPAINPGTFKTGVSLSMSFRTDSQYVAEPQNVFDYQWGSVFGGIGKSGNERLTDYFLAHSPFHFFSDPANHYLWELDFFFTCGDEEEMLDETNEQLHNLLLELDFPHIYRMKHGGHSWDYWHHELPEALKFIGCAFRDIPYPSDTVKKVDR